jgi:hypothetical protein
MVCGGHYFAAGADDANGRREKGRPPGSEQIRALLMAPEMILQRRRLPPPSPAQLDELLARAAAAELPAAWDARLLGWVSPVKMQGACWVFSAIGTMEAAIMKRNGGQVVDISEEEITSCHANGETGGMAYYAFAYILRRGIASEQHYPWNEADSNCHAPVLPDFFINDYSMLNVDFLPLADRLRLIKGVLLENGPVSTGFMVYEDFIRFSGRGVYVWNGGGELVGGHAVGIVGWQDDPAVVNGGYWICKNSWGLDWGESGFFRIAYGQCGIDDTIQYVAYDPLEPAPVFRSKGGIYYLQPGHAFSLDISARSNRGAVIRYSAEGLPYGAEYDADSGKFTWTPSRVQAGVFPVVFSAADGEHAACNEFTFIVSDYYHE